MNKTYLIVAGASAASLAAGAGGGYLIAKKKFLETLDATVAREVEATKKHYAVLLANKEKPSLEDVVSAYPDDVPLDEDMPLPLEAEEELEKPAEKALTNYQGFAKDEPAPTVIESNIFSNAAPKKKMPPREPGTGKFIPAVKEPETQPAVSEPYPISEHLFMLNEPEHGEEHEQESVLYFVAEDTAVLAADFNNVIENDMLGEFQLTKLRTGEKDVIYIRHDGARMDYQVTRTTDSLIEAMGLGESESDIDENDAAEHRTARENEAAYL